MMIHPLFYLRGRVARLVTQVADIVHAVVGGRVDLGHIQYGPVQYPPAGRAFVARVAVDRIFAVDRPGKDFCAGRLARASRTGKQVGMAQPSGLELRAERIRDMLLPNYVRECLRPPLAV